MKLYLKIILPFKLPTWNQLLAMHYRERSKLNNYLKDVVLESIVNANDSQTPIICQPKQSLTELERLEYLKMITSNASRKYRLQNKSKLKQTRKKKQ